MKHFKFARMSSLDLISIILPAVGIINGIAKSGRIDYGQAQVDAFLRQQDRIGVDKCSWLAFFPLECARKLVRVVQLGQEKGVDECRLAKARLAYHNQIELEAFLKPTFDRLDWVDWQSRHNYRDSLLWWPLFRSWSPLE